VVGGSFAAGTKVLLSIKPKGSSATKPNAYVVSASGELHRTYDVPAAEEYSVTATWDEEKVGTRALTKTVKGVTAEPTTARDPIAALLKALRAEHAGSTRREKQIISSLERLLDRVDG
jgi:hypothetical protein